jgi:hypothetical protein
MILLRPKDHPPFRLIRVELVYRSAVGLAGPRLCWNGRRGLTVCALPANLVLLRMSLDSDLAVSTVQLWIGQGHSLHYRPLQLLRSGPICYWSVLSICSVCILSYPSSFANVSKPFFGTDLSNASLPPSELLRYRFHCATSVAPFQLT